MSSCISQLMQYAQNIRDRAQNEYINELLTEGWVEGQTQLEAAIAASGESQDAELKTEVVNGEGYLIVSGSDSSFVEEGTGWQHPEYDWLGRTGTYAHGTYGKGRGAFPRKGWYHNGIFTSGWDPANALPVAEDKIIEVYENVAREVLLNG